MLRKIQWQGQTWEVVADVLVSDWWDYLFEITAPIVEAAEADVRIPEDAVHACMAWCAKFVDAEVQDLLDATHDAGERGQDIEPVFPLLADRIIEASSWSRGTRAGVNRFLEITFGAEDYDPAQGDSPCECRECKGAVPVDELCMFRQPPITGFSRQVATIDTELVAHMWNRPFGLYQLALIRQTQRNRGNLAESQKRERRRKRESLRDEILSQHGIH